MLLILVCGWTARGCVPMCRFASRCQYAFMYDYCNIIWFCICTSDVWERQCFRSIVFVGVCAREWNRIMCMMCEKYKQWIKMMITTSKLNVQNDKKLTYVLYMRIHCVRWHTYMDTHTHKHTLTYTWVLTTLR